MSIKNFKTLVDAIGTGTALLHEYRMATAVRWSLEHQSCLKPPEQHSHRDTLPELTNMETT